MLVLNYKRIACIGILLLLAFVFCEVALVNDDTGLNLHFGVWFTILIIVLFLLTLLFFILPLFYAPSYHHGLFITIVIVGLITIILPAINTYFTIAAALKPKENSIFSHLDLFKFSALRQRIKNIEEAIFVLLFLCQIVILWLSFKLRKMHKLQKNNFPFAE